MNAYVTKNKYLRIHEDSRKEQRSTRIIKRKESSENREAVDGTAGLLLKAFNGEIVSTVIDEKKLFIA